MFVQDFRKLLISNAALKAAIKNNFLFSRRQILAEVSDFELACLTEAICTSDRCTSTTADAELRYSISHDCDWLILADRSNERRFVYTVDMSLFTAACQEYLEKIAPDILITLSENERVVAVTCYEEGFCIPFDVMQTLLKIVGKGPEELGFNVEMEFDE